MYLSFRILDAEGSTGSDVFLIPCRGRLVKAEYDIMTVDIPSTFPFENRIAAPHDSTTGKVELRQPAQ